ncbi:MAG: pyruvate kinase [Planctomycetota bacterium]|nr:MAG: pyruvate kinase [Planctomycetota bacterium]
MPLAEHKQQRARTKIVATVGPACADEARLADLVAAGVDVFRLNLAHATREAHDASVAKIRRVSHHADRPVAILADLAGPKMRLNELPGGQIALALGDHVRFVRGELSDVPGELTTTYEPLVDELDAGDNVLLADGTIVLSVVEKDARSALCRVTQGGLLRSRQGVNLPGVKLSAPAMSADDREFAVWATKRDLDFVSLSFVRSPKEVCELKELVAASGGTARVIAKIEKREALDQLDAIVEAADGIMVARGDLGVEVDVATIALEQKRIIAACHRLGKPVITATQMLDSMQHQLRPTRAEATDVANAILDGTDACMLSGETAIGEYPRETVEMMNRIMLATEAMLDSGARHGTGPVFNKLAGCAAGASGVHPITAAVVASAARMAETLGAKLVAVRSRTGATALALSKQRGLVPTVGISDVPAVLRQMCLYWGVIPLWTAPIEHDSLIKYLDWWGRRDGTLAVGDRVVIVGGNYLVSGSHNIVEVHEVVDQT